MTLKEYFNKFLKKPYETLLDIKDNNDGSISIHSSIDTSHPDCPMFNFSRYSEDD